MSTKLQKKIEKEANRIVSPVVEADADGSANDAAAIGAAFVESDSGYTSSGKDESSVEAAMEPVAAAVPDSLHALDDAPVNSKIVVVHTDGTTYALLALPKGEPVRLPSDDPASKLTVGAKIQKVGDHEYVARQIGLGDNSPALVTTTARDAIAGFMAHFHG